MSQRVHRKGRMLDTTEVRLYIPFHSEKAWQRSAVVLLLGLPDRGHLEP